MFIHNLKYALKTLFKNKMLIFWTYLFPIILGSFFYLAFHDIETKETFDAIDIAIVDNKTWQSDEVWKTTMKELSEGKSKLFNIKYLKEDDCKDYLEENKIIGYLVLDKDETKVVVKKSDTSETIFKSVISEINSSKKMLSEYVETRANEKRNDGSLNEFEIYEFYNRIYEEAINLMNEETNITDKTSSSLSYTMIEYYTLIAMACLYGGILGMVAINQNLANMSNNGKRVSVSPAPKKVLILSSAIAGYIAQVIGVSLLFLFTIFILKVDYGSHLFLVILLALVGSLAGLMLGLCIASIVKSNENTKYGIVLSITMLGCFLSGMMGITMKYIVDKNIPFLNLINPASMITDGFYSLYYYNTYDRYIFNVISLLVFSFILFGISLYSLRRQKYDSI